MWQPIETAPTDGTPVLLWCAQAVKRGGYDEVPEAMRNVTLGWFGSPAHNGHLYAGKWVSSDVETSLFQGSEWTGSWNEYEWRVVAPTYWMALPPTPAA